MKREDTITRRAFIGLGLATTGAAVVACAEVGDPVEPGDPILAGTCASPPPSGACELTGADIEGPFYLADALERSDLDTLGQDGVALALSGRVTDVGCGPLANVVVEIWHADPAGEYDNTPTKNYRGWVRSDADGNYAFTTLVPGRYPNGGTLRPAHIHVKVWRDGAELLTTQLYFEGDPHLADDPWAEPARTVCLEPSGQGFAATFDIALG